MSQVKTYSAQAIAYIKQRLLDGTLSPGDPIRETEIAEHLGISRGPVREALQSLLQQGLVTGLPQKAKFIRHLTAREIEDSYCLGGTLEGPALSSPWSAGMTRPWAGWKKFWPKWSVRAAPPPVWPR